MSRKRAEARLRSSGPFRLEYPDQGTLQARSVQAEIGREMGVATHNLTTA